MQKSLTCTYCEFTKFRQLFFTAALFYNQSSIFAVDKYMHANDVITFHALRFTISIFITNITCIFLICDDNEKNPEIRLQYH